MAPSPLRLTLTLSLLLLACSGGAPPSEPAPQAPPPSPPVLEVGAAEGELAPGLRLAGAVRFEDLDAAGRPTLALTSWAEPSCGLVDWGDGREASWQLVRLPAAPGAVEIVHFEGQTPEPDRWGLERVGQLGGTLHLDGDSGRLEHADATVRFRLRDCGPQRL